MAEKKYYWLKLKKDFFKRHDIKIIENMPNGKDYVLFYLKLLVESLDHEGKLRFNESIPYDENMLSTITNTNKDIVLSAMKLFKNLEMIEILDDKTIYMNEVKKMIGSESYWAERKRIQRSETSTKSLKPGQSPTSPSNVQVMSTQELDIELEKEIDIDIEKDIEKEKDLKDLKEKNIKKRKTATKRFVPPKLEQVKLYCQERQNDVDPEKFINHYESVNWYRGKTKISDWKACVRTWERNNRQSKTNKADDLLHRIARGEE
jgi:predicted phage replisome organizer